MPYDPLDIVTVSPNQLDEECVNYLREVEYRGGGGFPGMFVPQAGPWLNGPRGGWWLFSLLGVAAIGALVAVTTQLVPENVHAAWPLPVQAFLAGLGAFLLLIGVVRFLRPKPDWLPGTFLYADANYLWDVTANRVVAVPLADLVSVDGSHHTSNGAYTHSQLEVRRSDGVRTWTVNGRAATENLLNFMQWLVVFRTSEQDHIRDWAATFPGRLGEAAVRFVTNGPNADISNLNAEAPPILDLESHDPFAPQYGWGGILLRCGVATVVGAGAYFALGLVNRHLQDAHLFAKIPARDNGSWTEMEEYLKTFPDGRHATAVREMRDDRRFTSAQRDAVQRESPGSLRQYLSDESNQRHRPEAQKLIAGFYDKAIVELTKKRETEPEKIDKDLFDGILALLDALKGAPRPVATVGFQSTIDPEPKTDLHKRREEGFIELYVEKNPELKDIAKRSASGSAIIGPDQIFSGEQTTRREDVILERLGTAVQRGIHADILTMEAVPAGSNPVIEVAYHILADGDLGIYTDPNKKLVGLLRWYAINWTITIRPPGMDKSYVYRLRSLPGAKLTYDSDPSDPKWAIYAVLLYSGFYEMSARLIQNFGLDPGETPNAFSYAATARHAPKIDDKLLNPKPLFEMPKLPRFGDKP